MDNDSMWLLNGWQNYQTGLESRTAIEVGVWETEGIVVFNRFLGRDETIKLNQTFVRVYRNHDTRWLNQFPIA